MLADWAAIGAGSTSIPNKPATEKNAGTITLQNLRIKSNPKYMRPNFNERPTDE
jgi:hypothetical protein